ncbi:MAG: DUF3089 domain-containing protein [Bacteroidetes bacterium]|nr:DUF3089 domain-containing protein [Bacteroidota bacterium]
MRFFAKLQIIIISCFITSIDFNAQPIDYTDTKNWAVLPNFQNNQLKMFIQDSSWIEKADVFYVYPTLLINAKDTTNNIDISHSEQRSKVLNYAVKYQASAWAESGRLFAPFYRQAHIRAYEKLDNGGRESLLLAYSDVKAAFLYYLENYNNGRPIILAGHSQGSTLISLLLKDLFDGTEIQKKLVAAYIPGIGIDTNMYSSLRLMKTPTEVNGFVTWNTFKKKINKKQYEKWYRGKSVINPITWDLTQFSDKSEHKGFLFKNGKIYRKSFSTTLIDGALWITTPNFPFKYLAFSMDDFHSGDINLFWEDIRINSKLRLAHWFTVHSGR